MNKEFKSLMIFKWYQMLGESKKSRDARAWLDNYNVCNKHVRSFGNIRTLLKKNGGLLRIENFLPDFVAEEALRIVEGINEEEWLATAADQDYRHNHISHHFLSTKHGQGLEPLLRVFNLFLPDDYNAFSAARYGKTDHIEPHDDKAYTDVLTDQGHILSCSRDIAIIYYLTKDWTEDMGGLLIDLVTGKSYVPMFNSVVAFQVPRFHEVTAVVGDRPRYSIFGWFLQPGKLYALYTGDEDGRKQLEKKKKEKRKKGVGDGDDGVPDCKLAQRILANYEKRKQKTKDTDADEEEEKVHVAIKQTTKRKKPLKQPSE